VSTVPQPDLLSGWDDWTWYVPSHDPNELQQICDPDDLEYQAVWMRPVRASEAENYGVFDPDSDHTVLRGDGGRFEPRWIWLECPEGRPGAQPFLGARYKKGLTQT
jgi:hypothetical protein